jgi:transcriptional regulator with XRE-family HTH domain
MVQSFPTLLKHWRMTRRMSQLDLGLAANVSARHISFLETARASPSRSMVLQLCQTLDVPMASQNTLLHAAGFAETYSNHDLSHAELLRVREALDWTLQRHDPFPGMALDKHWKVIRANRAATLLLSTVGLQEGDSLLQAMLTSERLQNAISNWQDVVRHMVIRLRSESARSGFDETLSLAATQLAVQLKDATPHGPLGEAVLTTRYVLNGLELQLFSTLAQFSSTENIALSDLRVELMYPADQHTKDILLSFASDT